LVLTSLIDYLIYSSSLLSAAPRRPDSDQYVQFNTFWIEQGSLKPEEPKSYILTPSIEQHIRDLARIVLFRKCPVLLQGPTSSGKTSMVEYLAHRTGHRFVRINNHEHTDLQEYLGTYVSDSQGNLTFQEGILVEALKNVWTKKASIAGDGCSLTC
jgi:midasin